MPWYRRRAADPGGPLFGAGAGGRERCRVLPARGPVRWCWTSSCYWFFVVNLFWAVLQHGAPCSPLDGGATAMLAMLSLFGWAAGRLLSAGLALLVSAAAVAWSLRSGGLPHRRLLRHVRLPGRCAPPSEAHEGAGAADPGELAPRVSRSSRPRRRWRRTSSRTRGAWPPPCWTRARRSPPELASRAHHTLGWVALKTGQGRAALDHFSQVQRQPVETQALAAAFSLIGDEGRALPLWEMAWRDTSNRTVMHEYAGSLIRAGKESPGAAAAPGGSRGGLLLRGAGALHPRRLLRGRRPWASGLWPTCPAPPSPMTRRVRSPVAHHVPDALRLLHRAKELGFPRMGPMPPRTRTWPPSMATRASRRG